MLAPDGASLGQILRLLVILVCGDMGRPCSSGQPPRQPQGVTGISLRSTVEDAMTELWHQTLFRCTSRGLAWTK